MKTFCMTGKGAFVQAIALALAVGTGSQILPDAARAEEASKSLSEAGKAKLRTLVDGARKEGRLSLVLGEGSLGGSNSVLARGFNAYYGLNIDIRFTPGPSMPNMAATVVQQHRARRPAATDVITGYGNHMTTLLRANALEKVDWSDWASNLRKPGQIEADGAAVPIMSSTPGIAYNTNVFKGKDIPTKFGDLLNPKLKGRVVTTPYASSFDRLATNELWGAAKTLDFARKLSAQIGGLMRCNEVNRIASGEFDVFGLTCSQSNGLRPASKGAPVGFTLASDAPIVMFLYQAVPANSAHPNAAKLWINYLLSKDVQKVLYESDFQDLHLLDGSRTGEKVREMEAKGTRFLTVDTNFYRIHDSAELGGVLKEVQKIFRGR